MKTLYVAIVLLLSGVLAGRGAQAACGGDCSGDGTVTVNELVLGVNIALGTAALGECASLDADGNGTVAINELIGAVNGALNGCGASDATPTPTATATSAVVVPTLGPRPTPAPGCGGGYAEATFSNAVGTNTREDLSATARLTKLQGNLNGVPGIIGSLTAVLNKCPIEVLGTTRTVTVGLIDSAIPVVGKVYQLNQSVGGSLPPSSFTYTEAFANPIGQLNWKATSGTAAIDAIDGDTVSFHVTDAQMAPAAPFPFGPPPMGTFTMSLTGIVDKVQR